MKNVVRSKGRIWKRRSKNLNSGEIQCHTCGEWKRVPKFTDRHFKEEYHCRSCNKMLNEGKPKPEPKAKDKKKPKRFKPYWPKDCPHRAFFWCKTPSRCVGCYYNPEKKIALMTRNEDDPKKTAKNDWFYGNKKHAKECLKLLEDIRLGRGLLPNGTRHRFKHQRKTDEDD